jgi:predicted ester cyclase
LARELLHPGFRFRGSLGPEACGVDGFIEYMRQVHAALSGYTCLIEDLVAIEARAAARLRFAGTHQGLLFGVPPSGRKIAWSGAAFFTIDACQIASAWVVGDVNEVRRQLDPGGALAPFA